MTTSGAYSLILLLDFGDPRCEVVVDDVFEFFLFFSVFEEVFDDVNFGVEKLFKTIEVVVNIFNTF